MHSLPAPPPSLQHPRLRPQPRSPLLRAARDAGQRAATSTARAGPSHASTDATGGAVCRVRPAPRRTSPPPTRTPSCTPSCDPTWRKSCERSRNATHRAKCVRPGLQTARRCRCVGSECWCSTLRLAALQPRSHYVSSRAGYARYSAYSRYSGYEAR
eukprot:6208115-Pleurochrysis_carterae.AAC.1